MVDLVFGPHTPVAALMLLREDEQMLATGDETKQLLVRVERVGRIIPQANFWLWMQDRGGWSSQVCIDGCLALSNCLCLFLAIEVGVYCRCEDKRTFRWRMS